MFQCISISTLLRRYWGVMQMFSPQNRHMEVCRNNILYWESMTNWWLSAVIIHFRSCVFSPKTSEAFLSIAGVYSTLTRRRVQAGGVLWKVSERKKGECLHFFPASFKYSAQWGWTNIKNTLNYNTPQHISTTDHAQSLKRIIVLNQHLSGGVKCIKFPFMSINPSDLLLAASKITV